MHYVWVDLAWGPNGTTGLAVLDNGAELPDITTRRTDQADPHVARAVSRRRLCSRHRRAADREQRDQQLAVRAAHRPVLRPLPGVLSLG